MSLDVIDMRCKHPSCSSVSRTYEIGLQCRHCGEQYIGLMTFGCGARDEPCPYCGVRGWRVGTAEDARLYRQIAREAKR